MKLTSNKKIVISFIGILLLVLRLFAPNIHVDSLFILLLAVIVLPWLGFAFESIEINGIKLKAEEIQKTINSIEVESNSAEVSDVLVSRDQPAFLDIKEKDPNLAIAGLRIEIEKRISLLTKVLGIQYSTLKSAIESLKTHNIFSNATSNALFELLKMSNLAIHGAEIKGNAFDIIMYDGLNIIKQLDKKYYDFCEKNNNKNIETGLIILKFYGQEVISYANDILKAILDEGTIRLAATYISENPKQDAQRVLMKLGAIEKTREIHGYFIFKVTEYGKFLSERLNESSIANVSQKSTEIISPPPHTQSQSSPAS